MSKLYVVPTPIGNLEDFTFRAQRVLNEVDLILAEDTRTSAKLMSHYSISTPMASNHMHNEHRSLQKWIEKILGGESIALISDAGTPAISDPGFLLVRECIKNDIEVDCLPGATAFVPALVNSGIGCERFVFEGFLPVKKGRQTRLQLLAQENKTMVFYESPYRVIKTLHQFSEFMGEDRYVSVSREISKKFEQTVRGSLKEVIAHFKNKEPKGEFVIILEGKKE
jgi:16S rRNA (cytidine1402-2'-O)-methyltransferase